MKTKDVKTLQITLQKSYSELNNVFHKDSQVETGILEDGTILYFIDGELTFFEKEDHIIVFLRVLLKDLIQLPKIIVDMGAIPFVVKGADVMVPGIVSSDENIVKNEYVVIIDEKHKKPLAIGFTLMDANEINVSKKGKAVKTLHFVGDRYWDSFSK